MYKHMKFWNCDDEQEAKCDCQTRQSGNQHQTLRLDFHTQVDPRQFRLAVTNPPLCYTLEPPSRAVCSAPSCSACTAETAISREISEIKKKKKKRQAGSAIVLRWLKLADKSFIREKSTICLSEQNPNTEYYLQPQHHSTEHDWALKLGFKIPKFSSSNSAIFSLNMSFVGFGLCEQDKEATSIFKIISVKWWNKITKCLMNEG